MANIRPKIKNDDKIRTAWNNNRDNGFGIKFGITGIITMNIKIVIPNHTVLNRIIRVLKILSGSSVFVPGKIPVIKPNTANPNNGAWSYGRKGIPTIGIKVDRYPRRIPILAASIILRKT